MSAAQTLDAIRTRLLPMVARCTRRRGRRSARSSPTSRSASCSYEERAERHVELRARFFDEIFPVLTPLAVDPGHPFPYISDLSLSLAVTVRDPVTDERLFARIKVPPVLPRLMEVGEHDLRAARAGHRRQPRRALPGHGGPRAPPLPRDAQRRPRASRRKRRRTCSMAIEEELRKRRFGKVVRLEVERSMPHATRAAADARPERRGAGRLRDLRHARPQRARRDRRSRRAGTCTTRPWQPVIPPRLLPLDPDEEADVFAAIRARRHPGPPPVRVVRGSVQRFIEQAAEDPDVLTIKQTLYRTSGDSPIVRSLIEAAEAGKQVVVLVEIKARFDEARQHRLGTRARARGRARRLRRRRPQDALQGRARRPARGPRPAPLRAYRHGQLQRQDRAQLRRPGPAHAPTSDLGADVTDLFNVLTGHSRQTRYRKLLVAPAMLRSGLIDLIDAERERHVEFGDGRIVIKLNADRRSRLDRRALPRVSRPASRSTSSCAACAPSGRACPGVERDDQRPLDRRPLPRALAHLPVSAGRARALLHRLGGSHGAQPRPARRGARARYRP